VWDRPLKVALPRLFNIAVLRKWKSIWRSKVFPRVVFLAWTAARNKILILDNLRRRGMVVVNK
jgi:hypothetical protein